MMSKINLCRDDSSLRNMKCRFSYFDAQERESMLREIRHLLKDFDLFTILNQQGDEELGIIETHEVVWLENGKAMLSGSAAVYDVSPDAPDLRQGEIYDLAITLSDYQIVDAGPATGTSISIGGVPNDTKRLFSANSIEAITPQEAWKLFSRLQKQPHIPFQYPKDGCWGRAHEMCRLIAKYLASSTRNVVAKIWIYASHPGGLMVETDNSPKCRVTWGWHVAPVVNVNGQFEVLDPSMFEKPVSLNDWRAAQNDPNSTYVITDHNIWYRDRDGNESLESEGQCRAVLDKYRGELVGQIYINGPIPYDACGR